MLSISLNIIITSCNLHKFMCAIYVCYLPIISMHILLLFICNTTRDFIAVTVFRNKVVKKTLTQPRNKRRKSRQNPPTPIICHRLRRSKINQRMTVAELARNTRLQKSKRSHHHPSKLKRMLTVNELTRNDLTKRLKRTRHHPSRNPWPPLRRGSNEKVTHYIWIPQCPASTICPMSRLSHFSIPLVAMRAR